MQFILSGEYRDGTLYAEQVDSLDMVAYTIGTIKLTDREGLPASERINPDSVKIETVEE